MKMQNRAAVVAPARSSASLADFKAAVYVAARETLGLGIREVDTMLRRWAIENRLDAAREALAKAEAKVSALELELEMEGGDS